MNRPLLRLATAALAIAAGIGCNRGDAALFDLDLRWGESGKRTVWFDRGGARGDYLVGLDKDVLGSSLVAAARIDADPANGASDMIGVTCITANGEVDTGFGSNGRAGDASKPPAEMTAVRLRSR